MTDSVSIPTGRAACHLEWFINARCDYTCRRCVPESSAHGRPELGLDGCMAALNSFVDFASDRKSRALITFYPRQAEFTERFTAVLDAVRDLKKLGKMGQVTCANRGDLPGGKIRLFRHAGVDVCRLTIDGPEPVQDELRRQGSFRDTLTAFRETRDSGISVVPLMILVRHNAPHVAETMRLMLDEGFDGFTLQVGIRGDAGGGNMKSSHHPDPDSPWNQSLSAGEYRAVLLDALNFLDSAGSRRRALRTRFVLDNQLYARLFFELGRLDEYERLAAGTTRESALQFVLKPDGAVLHQNHMPEMGAFPGGSFKKMYEASHPMRWFEQETDVEEYMAGKQKTFAKCRACPAAAHCRPTLVGAQGRRLFYYPDVHCWVDQPENTMGAS